MSGVQCNAKHLYEHSCMHVLIFWILLCNGTACGCSLEVVINEGSTVFVL